LKTSPLCSEDTLTGTGSASSSVTQSHSSAVDGCSESKFEIASVALRFAADSRYLPKRMKLMSIVTASKACWSSLPAAHAPMVQTGCISAVETERERSERD
jgi:hypothetical protein